MMTNLPFHSDFTCQYYSKNDFLRLIEQRVKKELRLTGELDFGTSYYVPKDGSLTAEVLVALLTHIFAERITLVREPTDDVATLDTHCLEEYLIDRVNVFFNGQDISNLKRSVRMPLRVVSAEEIVQLATCFGVQGSAPKVDNVFIDKLQEQYKQTKPSLLKSFMHIEEKFAQAEELSKNADV